MKLKSFMKVCNSTVTRFNVWEGHVKDGKCIETFVVDYCGKDIAALNKNIMKRIELANKGAEVEYVDVINGMMHVDCIVKEA